MDLLLILRDGLASSVVGTMVTAMRAKRSGQVVGVLVTQEALAALAQGTFAWPRELAGQPMRLALADHAKDLELPLVTKGEGRQLDVKAVVAKAREAGVALYACPTWTTLLGLAAPPAGLQALDHDAAVALLRDARRVVGSL